MELWYSLISGFTLGLLGSFHCIGMCGPLALSLPVKNLTGAKAYAAMGLYHTGRIMTYSVLGLLFGLVGSQLRLWGLQQILSIMAGIALLFFLLTRSKNLLQIKWMNRFFDRIQSRLQYLFLERPSMRIFLGIGLLNGLLPCGLVYAAVIAAIATSHVWMGGLLMSAFGLGTVPLMASLMVLGRRITQRQRQWINKAMPYMVSIMAVLLILRGLNLGIPMVSPKMEAVHHIASMCH